MKRPAIHLFLLLGSLALVILGTSFLPLAVAVPHPIAPLSSDTEAFTPPTLERPYPIPPETTTSEETKAPEETTGPVEMPILSAWFLPILPFGGVGEGTVIRLSSVSPEEASQRHVYNPIHNLELLRFFNDFSYRKTTEPVALFGDLYTFVFYDYDNETTHHITVSDNGYLLYGDAVYRILGWQDSSPALIREIYASATSSLFDAGPLTEFYTDTMIGHLPPFSFGRVWGTDNCRIVEPYTLSDLHNYWLIDNGEDTAAVKRRALSIESIRYLEEMAQRIVKESDVIVLPWFDSGFLAGKYPSLNVIPRDGIYYDSDSLRDPINANNIFREMLAAFSTSDSFWVAAPFELEGELHYKMVQGQLYGNEVWYLPAEAGDCDPNAIARALLDTLTEEEGSFPCYRLLNDRIEYYPSLYKAFLRVSGS
ncbi:MAG: hypothetical protein E7618_06445 [Ruminococcaceae bacterium]|nr:hypothetical protein [Oscillospiraceae bacterium]